jgi:2-oxoglutarate dehydrogenase E2 component (dihydrolipoamide succinyltransferase)
MAIDIIIPAFGESISEGTVAQWLKKDGDTVRRDEPIVEIESEKATQPLPLPRPAFCAASRRKATASKSVP